MPPSLVERQTRLAQIAQSAGVDISEPLKQPGPARALKPVLVSKKDRHNAQKLVDDAARKGRTLSILHRHGVLPTHLHRHEHIAKALSNHVLCHGSASVAQALLNGLGSTKNRDHKGQSTNTFKLPTGLLLSATRNKDSELVNVLASLATAAELDEALLLAVEANDPSCRSILVQHGADISTLCDPCTKDIVSNDTTVIEAIAAEGKPLHPHVLEACLTAALRAGNVRALEILLKCATSCTTMAHNGDLSWDRDGLLKMAIKRDSYQAFVIMAYRTATYPLHDSSLFSEIIQHPGKQIAGTATWVEVLLCLDDFSIAAGNFWQGNSMPFKDKLIDLSLLALLSSYGVSVSSQAFQLAADAGQLGLFEALLAHEDERLTVAWRSTDIFDLSSQTRARDLIIAKIIQSKIIDIEVVGETLIHATTQRSPDQVAGLLEAGASADYNRGQALKVCVQNQDEESFKLLTSHTLRRTTTLEILPVIWPLPKVTKLAFMTLILPQISDGLQLTRYLDASMSDQSEDHDPQLIMQIMRTGTMCTAIGLAAAIAKSDIETICFYSAVQRRCIYRRIMYAQGEAIPAIVSCLQYLRRQILQLDDVRLRECCIQLLDVHLSQYSSEGIVSLATCDLDLTPLYEIGPIDYLLVNLFGKHRSLLTLMEQGMITGYIVCAQPLSIASAFIEYLRVATTQHRTERSKVVYDLVLHVAGHYLEDDAEKTSKLRVLTYGSCGIPITSRLIVQCLELHLRSLVGGSRSHLWPTGTTHFLCAGLREVDNIYYSCIRMAAFEEQMGTLEYLFKASPRPILVGGDMLRPLVRYRKLATLQYLLGRWVAPTLPEQLLYHARDFGLSELAVLILKHGTSHQGDAQCRCLKKTALDQSHDFIVSLIDQGHLDPGTQLHLWHHLDPQVGQREKHAMLAALLRGQPRPQLVQQLFVEAAESGDMSLCHVILSDDNSEKAVLPSSMHSVSPNQELGAWRSTHGSTARIEDAMLHHATLAAVGRGDVGVCELLLNHKAQIGYNSFELIRLAIESASINSLQILSSIISHTEAQVRPKILNECLWRATVFNKPDTCAWLLNKGASPLIRGYGPVLTAAERGLIEILQMFLQHDGVQQEVLIAAFRSSYKTSLRGSVPSQQRIEVTKMLIEAGMRDEAALGDALIAVSSESNPGPVLVALLLNSGASILHNQGQCLVEAWRAAHLWLLKRLCLGQSKLPTAARCLKEACADYGKIRPHTIDMLEVVAFILGLGVPQAALDEEIASALSTAVTTSKERNMLLVHLLVSRGAALDPNSATSLFHASVVGDDLFLRTAMRFGPSREVRFQALDLLFSDASTSPEAEVASLNMLFAHGDMMRVIKCDRLVDMLKAILLTRKTMPLIHALLSKCGIRSKGVSCLGKLLCSNPQEVRDLLEWAIPCELVESSCIGGLLRCIYFEADLEPGPSFSSQTLSKVLWNSKPSSLLLSALQHSRSSLVPVMVHAGAPPDIQDSRGKSALTLAIERRLITAADALLAAGTRVNDGSLHAAACMQDVHMVRRLRDCGHSPTARPVSANGLSALEALLRHEYPSHRLRPTVTALTEGSEKPGLWISSPSHLWVALQSKTPSALARALLDNMPRDKLILDEIFLWKQMYYSPVCWVEQDMCPHLLPDEKQNLVRYLLRVGLPRTYYALEGPQPQGAIGVPQKLLDVENDRLRRLAHDEKDCAICGDKPERYIDVHAQLTSICEGTHSWNDEIICIDCLIGHISAQIYPEGVEKQARSNPRCWAPKCRGALTHADIKRYLDETFFEEYDSKLTMQLLHTNSQSARCANTKRNCRGGAWFSKADLEELSFFRCPTCQELTCLQCNSLYEPSHLSTPCPVSTIRRRQEEDKESEQTVKTISKECECGAHIQKSEGCDHMTCKYCPLIPCFFLYRAFLGITASSALRFP